MKILERKPCPLCKLSTSMPHCRIGSTCNWYMCTKCTTAGTALVIFNLDGRYFIWREDGI